MLCVCSTRSAGRYVCWWTRACVRARIRITTRWRRTSSADPWYSFVSRPLLMRSRCICTPPILLWLGVSLVGAPGRRWGSGSTLIGALQPGRRDRQRRRTVRPQLATAARRIAKRRAGWAADPGRRLARQPSSFSALRPARLVPGQFDWTWQVIRVLRALGLATRCAPGTQPATAIYSGDRLTMQVTELFEKAPYDPDDPNPWLALYLGHEPAAQRRGQSRAAGQFRLEVAPARAAADPAAREADDDAHFRC